MTTRYPSNSKNIRPASRKACASTSLHFFASLLCLLASASGIIRADESGAAIAPKPLINLSSPDAIKQIRTTGGDPTYTVDKGAIVVSLPGSPSSFPGIQIIPATGDSWDLSPSGHIEAKITNTGDNPIRVAIRVDGFYADSPLSTGNLIVVKPGESGVIKGIFGSISPSKIVQVLLFLGKSETPQSFRVEDLQAAGPEGEKPPVNPDTVAVKPPNGVILGKGVAFDPAKQVIAKKEQVSEGPEGTLAIHFTGDKEESLRIKPPAGLWNLSEANQIRVKFKNVGVNPATPTVVVGPNKVAPKAPIAPGAEAEVAVSFIPDVSEVLITVDGKNQTSPGTGTTFDSDRAREFAILSDTTPGEKKLLISSIVADAAIAEIPDWLGKKPPVDGDWVQTFDEEFDGPAIDFNKWNIYGDNYWDSRTHFSKDNAILKDGKMIFHYEKKRGFHNDDPNDPKARQTDYACGFLTTYGKWTQRYGYFESRMKLPKASGLWPAFWLMPDRGKDSGSRFRPGTGKQDTDIGVGGMEFDIMEFLSGWGVHRFNVAFHWDGYGRDHKSVGSGRIYARTDKDGYTTTGLLWTPGSAIIYVNGKEALRWENPRISDVQSYIMYDMVTGGWANTMFDDTQLPDDFLIDYVRVWQRKELATPEDGPKPNTGDPNEKHN